MRKNQNNRCYVCLLLAILLFFSGMCLRFEQTDSFFSYSSDRNLTSKASVFRQQKPEVPFSSLCTDEMLGSRTSATAILQTRTKTEKNNSFSGQLFFLLCLLVPSFHLIFLTISRELQYDDFVTAIIISYIHNQDGKKSPLLFYWNHFTIKRRKRSFYHENYCAYYYGTLQHYRLFQYVLSGSISLLDHCPKDIPQAKIPCLSL
jgi:hypothetical protein